MTPVETLFDTVAQLREAKTIQNRLYEHIAHGDAEHRAWLKTEIDKFFAVNKIDALLEVIELQTETINYALKACKSNPGWVDTLEGALAESAKLLKEHGK